jgi:uncharacterized protein (TIGR03437 family)
MDREGGALYRRSWEQALESDPQWILITSWNEFLEHTHIEPSEMWGDQYLRITREYVSRWKSDYPLISAGGVVNAASYESNSIAPGELVTVFGRALGPGDLRGMILTSDGKSASTDIAGVKVYFDGVPASLVFVRADQIAAVVPPAGAQRDKTLVEVEYQGHQSPGVEVAVQPHSPGIFTLDSSGRGQAAAILHADSTVNGPSNPASKNSILSVFGTGGGLPAGTGSPGDIATAADELQTPVSATVGGAPAEVLYAGTSPGLLRSVMQINLRLAKETPVGNAVPLIITLGQTNTQPGVTLAIR